MTFLGRVYDMDSLPPTDRRFPTAAGDVMQHRLANEDWDDGWIFRDDRFGLRNGDDETFLRFLAATVHPALRRGADEV